MLNYKKALVTTLIVLMLTAMIVPLVKADLTTDKQDYAPIDPVNVTGTDFLANHEVTLTLMGPDGFENYTWTVVSDENGTINTTYDEGLMNGNFTLVATDGTNTQTTTFTDDGLQVKGTDNNSHNQRTNAENFGTIPKGNSLVIDAIAITATGIGTSESVDWSDSYDGTYGDSATIASVASSNSSGGTFTKSVNSAGIKLTIDTSTLTVGKLYSAKILFTAEFTAGNQYGVYYFNFTVGAPTPSGTTLSASVSATPTYTRTFEWTIDKSANATTLNLFKGDSADVKYTITATKSSGTDAATLSGNVVVTNTGTVATTGLAITVEAQRLIGATWTQIVSPTSVDASSNPTLDPNEQGTYAYSLTLGSSDVASGDSYRVVAHVTITNYAGQSGAYGPNPNSDPVTMPDPTLINDQINVDDTYNSLSWTFSASGSQTYVRTFSAETDASKYTDGLATNDFENTATIRGTTTTSSVTVTVNSYMLLVSKTAATSYTRTYNWAISKSVDKSVIYTYGGTATFNYNVTVWQTGYTDSNWKITGTITITNPNIANSVTVNIGDVNTNGGGSFAITQATDATGSGTTYTIAADTTATFDYTITFASAPTSLTGTNKATATINNDLSGITSGTTTFESSPLNTNFGSPTTTVDKTITIQDTFDGTTDVLGTLTATDSEPYTIQQYLYDHTVSPSTTTTYTNTAEIVETEQTASKTVTVTVLPTNIVTGGLCPLNDNTFQLNFIQDPHAATIGNFKLVSSNPGQFYYNVFYIGTPGTTVTLTLTLPPEFVTQGAMPIQAYSDVTIGADGCFIPSGVMYVSDASALDGTITLTVPASGLIYINVHLDYAYKQQTNFQQSGTNALNGGGSGTITINDNTAYTFSFSVTGGDSKTDSTAVYNSNVFKKNAGFGGAITDIDGNGISGLKVLFKVNGKNVGNTITDDNGLYLFSYKWTGKATTYEIVINGVTVDTGSLKANGFVLSEFIE